MTQSSNQKKKRDSDIEDGDTAGSGEPADRLIPKWVKTAGTLAGIIVALLGAFVGIYQVAVSLRQIDVNIEKERRGSDEAKAQQAEEARKKAEVESTRSLGEAAAKIELRQKDLDVKDAEVAREAIAKQAMLLGIEKEVQTKTLDEKFKVEAEKRGQTREENSNFTENLHGVFKPEGALPSLARLTKYAHPGDERLGSILTPLVAKLDEVRSPSEVNIVFQLFERVGPSALGSVIDSNRNALERYTSETKKLALFQFNLDRKILLDQISNRPGEIVHLVSLLERSAATVMSTQDPNTGLGLLQREIIEDVWDQIARSLTGRRTYREVKWSESSELLSIKPEVLARLELATGVEGPEDIRRTLSVQLAILRQSKRTLLRLLKQTHDFADLTGADVSGIRFLPGEYGAMNFSDAFVAGTDFSAARLDLVTLDSLGEAFIARERKVRGNLPSSSIRLSSEQLAAITRGPISRNN